MDLQSTVEDFLSKYPHFNKKLQRFICEKNWTSSVCDQVLEVISELLISSDGILPVSNHFAPILLCLFNISAKNVRKGKEFSIERHEKLCLCLCKLSLTCSTALRFALEYFETNPSIFERFKNLCGSSRSSRQKKLKRNHESSVVQSIDVVRSAYEFLRLSPSYFATTWDWTSILEQLRSSDEQIKWFSCLCCSILFNLSATETAEFLSKHFDSEKIKELTIKFADRDNDFSPSTTTGLKKIDFDVGSNVACVCGVLLPCYKQTSKKEGTMVTVPSTCLNLYSLALAVKRGLPVLLQGPIGCGKTSLVEHVAAVTGRSEQPLLLKVQLGDQTDSKMLIGTYQCTEVPGEFIWQPGALLQAVENGYWILLEDIDYAPMDVVATLIPLLETRSLTVPGHGRTAKAAPGFQLFATRRLISGSSGFHKNRSSNDNLLEKLFTKISVEPLTTVELVQVLKMKWPALEVAIDRLIEIYLLTSSGRHDNNDIGVERILPTDARPISTRDLFKWCQRVVDNFISSPELSAVLTFQDALDCFCASISKLELKMKVAVEIGARLNVTKSKTEYLCTKYKPNVTSTRKNISVGRATIPKMARDGISVRSARSTFAFTRQSSVLLEQIVVAVCNYEPVLLVGETGTGKTATVQYLAKETGHKLIVMNMNQHSDSADLLGGFKPVDLRLLVLPLKEEYEDVFCQTFSRSQNLQFLGHINTCYERRQWSDLFKLLGHTYNSGVKRLESSNSQDDKSKDLLQRWHVIAEKIDVLRSQIRRSESALAFTFVEGSLVRAVREGHWILLDEVNLASAETLECLSGLLESAKGSVLLLERGDAKTVERHPDFRLFACMNPATDVGKKELPPGLRNRFTEFFMEDLEDSADLSILTQHYLKSLSPPPAQVNGIVNFYLQVRKEASKTLTDGTGRKPHYSLRTLCRALSYAAENPCRGTQRSLYEAFCMSFLTQLDRNSHPIVENLVIKCLLPEQSFKGILKQPLPEPTNGEHVNFEGFWIPKGTKNLSVSDTYIMTPSVRRNLLDLARVVSAGRHPVLLQGDTSVGKTSLVKWLADASGHHCVRVNNHEHTDLQEYVGSYIADQSGKLVFKEGVLVNAMRQGHWIILDELNLAPTDVLEALNRVLDDNRELFITETQETVKAHPKFQLFATQNPPGHYGGRKVLSRAFRNRFIELHFDQIPAKELQTILHRRCSLPLSYCSKLVAVLTELQTRRSGSGIFAGKQGFITLRDLFRWAERYRLASQQIVKFYDWDQHLADEGYLLVAGRVRKRDEEEVVLEVLKKHFKRTVDPQRLFAATVEDASPTTAEVIRKLVCIADLPNGYKHLVWTFSMRRLAVLLGQGLRFDEPILMVGDTGCGKTTMCQLFAALSSLNLHYVNCHLHSEGADFLGGLRPVRNREEVENDERLFEWVDGPLVTSMKEGSVFLADEISLADDSVLERLNSVLEPERTLLLAEKGADPDDGDVEIVAEKEFRFVATMNPGGDYGKKELSPALRNRFTEIWCPNSNSREDLLHIIEHNLSQGLGLCNTEDGTSGIGHAMLDFLEWFTSNPLVNKVVVSVRDILAWVNFINACANLRQKSIDVGSSYIHGACLVILDAIGSGNSVSVSVGKMNLFRNACLGFLLAQTERLSGRPYDGSAFGLTQQTQSCRLNFALCDEHSFGVEPFYIEKGPNECESLDVSFTMSAPTTAVNALRLLRALQLTKPVLLEGSPGVGKTSLVVALAKASGHNIVRINLSEQTDISDLFGADLPVDGGRGGQFAWRDGPLLRALKQGHWVVLDELNLASQSVLEGLNACLDHRAEIYIPELGRSFCVPGGTKRRIFACQNPLYQGGARKGLPKSFLNRFIQVYVEPLSTTDLEFIAAMMYPRIPGTVISSMVRFNQQVYLETVVDRSWGTVGGPWEVNLRDIFRWCELLISDQKEFDDFDSDSLNLGKYVGLIYADRMRTKQDKQKIVDLCETILNSEIGHPCSSLSVTKHWVQVGDAILPRITRVTSDVFEFRGGSDLFLLPSQLGPLESLMKCIQMNWMAILVGPHASGKTSLVTALAQLTGSDLKVLNMNSDMDTTELLGGFEQVDLKRHLADVSEDARRLVDSYIRNLLIGGTEVAAVTKLMTSWNEFVLLDKNVSVSGIIKSKEEVTQFLNKAKKLKNILQSISFSSSIIESSELLETMNKISSLEMLVEKEDTLSCGGRFEWVDSILVTALQKGHWLLADNVNFCSPSVLDRLNALLEPNGVLTISERGIVGQEIPVVKPHPNFRLIMSMDPQNGEISRAMRNRGVEIFIVAENEFLRFGERELCTILTNVGLSDIHVQKGIVEIHEKVAQITSGGYKLSLSDLIRASQLTVQRVQEGCDMAKAFEDSCLDVYVRCHYSNDKKKQAKNILEEVLASISFDEAVTAGHCLSPVSHYKVLPELTTIKQDMAIVNCIVHLAKNFSESSNIGWYNEKFTKDFGCFDKNRLETTFATAVAAFLQKSTSYDFKLRLSWLSRVLSEAVTSSDAESILGTFRSFVGRIDKDSLSVFDEFVIQIENLNAKDNHLDVLFDPRYNMEILKHLEVVLDRGDEKKTHERLALANRFHLLLRHTMLKVESGFQLSSSKVVASNHFPNVHFAKMFVLLFAALKQFIANSEIIVDHKINEWEINVQTLHYVYVCVSGLCSKVTLSSDEQMQVKLHFSMLIENVYPLLFGVSWEAEKMRKYPFLWPVYKKISAFFRKQLNANMNRFGVKLLQSLGHPKAYKTLLDADLHFRLNRLWNPQNIALCLSQSLSSGKDGLLKFCLTDAGRVFKQKLCHLFFKNSLEDYCSEVEQLEAELKRISLSGKLKDDDEGDEETTTESDHVISEDDAFRTELLPLVDHFTVLQVQRCLCLMLDISQKHSDDFGSFGSLLDCAFELLNVGISTTVKQLALVNELQDVLWSDDFSKIGFNEWQTMEMESEFYNFCHQSACVDDAIFTKFNKNCDRVQRNSYKPTGAEFIVSPYLSVLISKILFNGDNERKTESSVSLINLQLSHCKEKIAQLGSLKRLLWSNAPMIGSLNYDPYRNSRVIFNGSLVRVAKLFCAAVGASDLISELEDSMIVSSSSKFISTLMTIESKLCGSQFSKEVRDAWHTICELAADDEFEGDYALAFGCLGWLQVALLIPIFEVDPVEQQKFSLRHCKYEISRLEAELHVANCEMLATFGCSLSECDLKSLHPSVVRSSNRIDDLRLVHKKLENNLPCRPTPSQYEGVCREFSNFWVTFGSLGFEMLTGWKNSEPSFMVLDKIQRWLDSQFAFLDRISVSYPLYRDLTQPCCLGILQMVHGVSLLRHQKEVEMNCKITKTQESKLVSLVKNKMTFPYHPIDIAADCHVSSKPAVHIAEQMLNYIISSDVLTEDDQIIRLVFMSSLSELRNQAIISDGVDFEWNVFEKSMKMFAVLWNMQDERRRQDEAERESLYELRPREHGEIIDDEEELKAAVQSTFPSYHEVFEDLVPPNLLDDSRVEDTGKSTASSDEKFEMLSEGDIDEIVCMYKELITRYCVSPWYRSRATEKKPDVSGPLLLRYPVFSDFVRQFGFMLENSLDSHSIGGHLIYIASHQNLSQKEKIAKESFDGKSKVYDFYHDPNVDAVLSGLPVMTRFFARIREVLVDWPAHPMLLQLVRIIERVLNLPITSPVIKFITGFEMLLGQAQDWEQNAHKGVSLFQQLKEVTEQIICWRKLEIKCWSSCLDFVETRAYAKTSRWWLFLYKSMQFPLNVSSERAGKKQILSNEGGSVADFCKVLQSFMETSSLGEFRGRLDLMFSFACYFTRDTDFRQDVRELLWNMYEYYGQFVPVVEKKIKALRTPIEKNLKGFIKIARWNDINFYAVKQAVEKSHYTLLKQTRLYEAALRQSLQVVFADEDLLSRSDSNSKSNVALSSYPTVRSYFDIATKVAVPTVESTGTAVVAFNADDLSQLPLLCSKARKLCRKLVKNGWYGKKIEALDDFVGDVISTVNELQALDVNKSATKEKQVSEAKNINLRKRKALSDLFKHLTTIGVSYRKGLLGNAADAEIMELTPIDISVAQANLDAMKTDSYLLELWRDCPRYIHRSVARMALLRSSLQNPSKELGPANLQRCQGYPAQLLRISVEQRNELAPFLRALSDMRFVIKNFDALQSSSSGEQKTFAVTQAKLHKAFADIRSMVTDAYLCLEQFRDLLNACPLKDSGLSGLEAVVLSDGHERSAIATASKDDDWWQATMTKTENCIVSVKHLRDSLSQESLQSCCCEDVLPFRDASVVEKFLAEIEELLTSFPVLSDDSDIDALKSNPLTAALALWSERIGQSLTKTHSLLRDVLDGVPNVKPSRVSAVPNIVRELTRKVLKVIEKLVKRTESKTRSDKDIEEEEEEEESWNETGLLSDSLHHDLVEVVHLFKAKMIRNKIVELYGAITSWNEHDKPSDVQENLNEALQAVNLVRQYVNLSQFYLNSLVGTHRVTTKMCSVLLGIFIELVRKGFCVPEEYSDEVNGEGATTFEDVGGMGIGEGEGVKDVSERIENEDQLEEAHQEGKEKQEEEKDAEPKPDLKDEEHGIEMTDDFDGKTHDFDQNEGEEDESNEEEENSENEEELDKQMGDLEDEDAEKLDEKIWGDDEDEEDDDEEEDGDEEKEEYGPGDGPQEESRIVAKDDNKNKNDRGDDEDDDEKEEDNSDEPKDKDGQINTIDDRECEDKPDKYYEDGAKNEIEPEEMELPQDMNLDDKEEGEGDESAADEEEEEEEGGDDEPSKDEGAIDENETEEQIDETDDQKEKMGMDDDNVKNDDADVKEEEEEDDDEEKQESEEKDEGAENNVNEEEEVGLEPEAMDDDSERAAPSSEKTEDTDQVQASEKDAKGSSADTVDPSSSKDNEKVEKDESTVNDAPNEDTSGVGLADAENTQGHESNKSELQQTDRVSSETPQRAHDKLGKAKEKRSLGVADKSNLKRLKTEDQKDEGEGEEETAELEDEEKKKTVSDVYRHILQSEKHYDAQTLDAATQDQALQEEQAVPNEEDENCDEAVGEDDDVQMLNQEEKPIDDEEVAEKKPSSMKQVDQKLHSRVNDENMEVDAERQEDVVVEGEIVITFGAERGPETTFHSQLEKWLSLEARPLDMDRLRQELEEQLQEWKEMSKNAVQPDNKISRHDAQDAWQKYEEVTSQLSQDLCEQLRLVLEPSLTAKLKGDYRTGKRLNMRKVIPYVASQFRKDKIWLRRTKPSKREYQIMLAIDDSSSMADNHSKQLAFEALALICNSLMLLEAGEVAVASFGETVQMLHSLGDQFSSQAGAEILREFTFEQQKTRIGMMLDQAVSTMLDSRKRLRSTGSKSNDIAQLLVIVSDGRGLFNEGVETVQKAVRRARESGLFTAFVIIDNPANKDSILDIRVPVFKGSGQLPEIKSYMDDFPFPFYILLRDINSLPSILSEALRQWFEMISSIER